VLCLIQFNCTDECPEYAPYTYTMEMEDGDKTALCTAADHNALGYVTSFNCFYNLCSMQYVVKPSRSRRCVVRVSDVNRIGDKSRLSATENFETVL